MADVSQWDANELKNLKLDELNLSDERGKRTAKIMSAVKKKFDEVDGKLDAVAGGLVFRGAKATYADLEAVTDPAVGDMYSVTELGGENYAWDGTAWDVLGTSDANVVHKTGNETIEGTKTFSSTIKLPYTAITRQFSKSALRLFGGNAGDSGAGLTLAAPDRDADPNVFTLSTGGGTNPELVGEPGGSLSWGGQPLQTTSDERRKTEIESIPDAVLDAWEDVHWGQFQFLDAVERKGKDARLHLGLIAQRVKAVFEAHGLDACAYGILCHDYAPARTWTEPGDGGAPEERSSPAVDVWTVRYAEALAMEAACQRRRADRLEMRVEVLEARLNGNV